MISSTWFTIMVIFVLLMGTIDRNRRIQWYVFGIFVCLVTITNILFAYFGMWSNLLPQFVDPAFRMPGGVS